MKRSLVPPHGREPLTYKNPQQKEVLQALTSGQQVFITGQAGTGKTYLPTAYAANLLLQGTIDHFFISRPAVAVGERHGFLPGKLEQKLAPWVLPVIDVVEERLGVENTRKLLADETIKVQAFEYMRGRTFKNAFVLLDEAQNTTVEQMKMFLTRIGEGSRLVVTGDLGQSDIGTDNGLAYALRIAAEYNIPIRHVRLTKTERSGICAVWADAFEGNVAHLPEFIMKRAA